MKSTTLDIHTIVTPTNRLRTVDEKKVSELAKSIHTLGLLSPIVVSKNKKTLIAGAHRLEACLLLKHETIDARILETDDDARLVEIEENYVRNDLKTAQKKEHALARIDEIMLRMKDEVYQDAIQDSINNGNLSKKDAPEVLQIAKGFKSVNEASNNKVKEASTKALNAIKKRAIEITEGEYHLSKRYLRDALRARESLISTKPFKAQTTNAEEFKTNVQKRVKRIVSEFEAELDNYVDDEQYDELSSLIERLKGFA